MDDSDCDVGTLNDIKADGQAMTRQGDLLEYHRLKFKLYLIMGPFLSRRLQSNQSETLNGIHTELVSWKSKLPDKLRLETYKDDPSNESHILQMQALALQLTYDNLQIILHRRAAFGDSERVFNSNEGATLDSSLSQQQLLESALRTSQLYRHVQLLQECRRTHAVMHIGICLFTSGVVLCAMALAYPLSTVSQKAKEGVMHILRLQQDSISSQHLLSVQSMQILRDLVTVVMSSEERAILGHSSAPATSLPEMPHDDPANSVLPQASSVVPDLVSRDNSGTFLPFSNQTPLNTLQQGQYSVIACDLRRFLKNTQSLRNI